MKYWERQAQLVMVLFLIVAEVEVEKLISVLSWVSYLSLVLSQWVENFVVALKEALQKE